MSGNIEQLRAAVRERMSEKRFCHTLGVERLAAHLGELVMPERVFELRCAALLHDIAKELPKTETLQLLSSISGITDEDMKSPSVFHAFVAPEIVKRDFPEYATPDILSAIFNHTTGDADMSLFDEIIFISDFAEEGRVYPSCREIAKKLDERCRIAKDRDECIKAIHKTTYDTLLSVISTLERLGRHINQRTLLTRSAFAVKI